MAADSAPQRRRRGPGRPFKPGQSGNPSGHPAGTAELRQIARAHSLAAIEALVAALSDPRNRVAAAVALLDRGWGKPAQPVDGDGEGGPVCITYRWASPDAAAP